jgi:hypothetical protein
VVFYFIESGREEGQAMENKSLIDFMVRFNQLNETNQKYIIAIQQALAFAQESAEGELCRKSKKK